VSVPSSFPPTPRSVAAVRRLIRRELSGEPVETIEAAALMASELATNCVMHARTEFEVSVTRGEEIRVEFSDASPALPQPGQPSPSSASGRGLLIVSSMAKRWGAEPAEGGKTVWFTIACGDAGEGSAPAVYPEPAGLAAESRVAAMSSEPGPEPGMPGPGGLVS